MTVVLRLLLGILEGVRERVLDDDVVEEQWLRHLGHRRDFPREVAHCARNGKSFCRMTAEDAEEYMTIIRRRRGSKNLYAGLYSNRQRKSRLFDRVVFDIDATDGTIKGSLRLMKLVANHVRDVYGIEPTVYCTGGKGYHIIVYFPEIDVSKLAVRRWSKSFVDEAVYNSDFIKSKGEDGAEVANLLLEQLDTTVLGDIMQVTRLPYTYNLIGTHKFRFCAPIDIDWDYDRIRGELIDPEKLIEFEVSDEIARDIVKVDINIDESDRQYSFDGDYDSKTGKQYERELLQLFNLADKIRDGRRRILSFLIIPRLVAIGEEKHQVKRFCADWLRRTGKPPHQYDRLIDHQYTRTLEGPSKDINDDNYWMPWTFEKFFSEFKSIKSSVDCAERLLEGKK